jgi:cation transport ATPase
VDRPLDQRIREFKYRFGQSVVFGIPVLVLQWLGPSLGGETHEASDRWVPLFQALLAGWVTYVAAFGMLADDVIQALEHRRFPLDLFVSSIAIGLYLFSMISVLAVLVVGHVWYRPILFHVVILILIAWCAGRWWQHSRIHAGF